MIKSRCHTYMMKEYNNEYNNEDLVAITYHLTMYDNDNLTWWQSIWQSYLMTEYMTILPDDRVYDNLTWWQSIWQSYLMTEYMTILPDDRVYDNPDTPVVDWLQCSSTLWSNIEKKNAKLRQGYWKNCESCDNVICATIFANFAIV